MHSFISVVYLAFRIQVFFLNKYNISHRVEHHLNLEILDMLFPDKLLNHATHHALKSNSRFLLYKAMVLSILSKPSLFLLTPKHSIRLRPVKDCTEHIPSPIQTNPILPYPLPLYKYTVYQVPYKSHLTQLSLH